MRLEDDADRELVLEEQEHEISEQGTNLRSKKRHGKSKPTKNMMIIVYTTFTCLSCAYLETQVLNPFIPDFKSKMLSYICYVNVVLCIWSYFQTIITKSNVPKLRKVGIIEGVSRPILDKAYDLTGKLCTKCNFVKFPRVSHCSTCSDCTYKLDHHCIWTQSCIGYRNQRSFYLFTFYMSWGVIQFWYSSYRILSLMYGSCNFLSFFSVQVYLLWAMTCFSVFFVGMMILGLSISHTVMILTNYTTLDNIKNKRVCPVPFFQCRRPQILTEHINMFDRGQIQNIRAMLGSNIFTFWMPLVRQITNELIIEPMNPYPARVGIETFNNSTFKIQEFKRLLYEVKDIYKDKIITVNEQTIQL